MLPASLLSCQYVSLDGILAAVDLAGNGLHNLRLVFAESELRHIVRWLISLMHGHLLQAEFSLIKM